MKTFEIFSESKKKGQNGRRKFKAILYQIFPDSCVDEEAQAGTQYNKNGITWLREYCEKALPSIKGMSLKCEFLDEERTELCGHGMTDIEDGIVNLTSMLLIHLLLLLNSFIRNANGLKLISKYQLLVRTSLLMVVDTIRPPPKMRWNIVIHKVV